MERAQPSQHCPFLWRNPSWGKNIHVCRVCWWWVMPLSMWYVSVSCACVNENNFVFWISILLISQNICLVFFCLCLSVLFYLLLTIDFFFPTLHLVPFIWIVVYRDCLQHQGAAWLLWSRSSWPWTCVWVIGQPSTTFANCFKCWRTCSLWGFCMKTSKVRWSDLQSRGCIIYMKNQRCDHLTDPSLGAACMKTSKVRSCDLQFGDSVQRHQRWDHLTFSLWLHV